MIDLDIQQELQPDLIDSEKLLWTGRPRGGLIFRRADWFVIPFSLVWTGVILVMIIVVAFQGAPVFVYLFLVPFVAVGYFITVGRFVYDIKRRAHTMYGITNDRVIIRSGIRRPTINSFNIKAQSNITLDEKTDGNGTITFGANAMPPTQAVGSAIWVRSTNLSVPSIESIDNVKEAYNLILKLQKNGS